MVEERHDSQISASFLVRCWTEPREAAERPEVLRFYVRDLRTGEEHYLNEPSQLGELVVKGVRRGAGGATGRDAGRSVEVG